MKRSVGYGSAVILVTLAFSRVLSGSAQQIDVDYVLPDPPYVQAECSRLVKLAQRTGALENAGRTVAAACTQYATNHDGYAWFAAINGARVAIDSYDADPTKHAAIIVTPRETVPRNGSVYALFLVTSKSWQTRNTDLSDLRDHFEDFGRSIGGRQLAIWFESPTDPDQVDILRSKWYCDNVFHFQNLSLDYNSGPYVVITSTRPDQWSRANDAVILKLSGISSQHLGELLNILEQQLRTTGHAKKTPLLFAEIEKRLITAKDRNPSFFHSIVMLIFQSK